MRFKPAMSDNALFLWEKVISRGSLFVLGTLGCLLCSASSAQQQALAIVDGREHLANLSATEKEELRRKREQFEQLADAEKDRLREMHSAITSSPDRARLEATLLQYHEWLKSLPGKERSDLLQLPEEEKIAEIKRLMQEQRSLEFRKFVAKPPEPNDIRAIFEWFDSYVEAHEGELLAMLPEPMQTRVRQITIASVRRKMLALAAHQSNPEGRFPAPTEDDLRKLNERLSPHARETLARAANPEAKLKLVQGWLHAAMASRLVQPQVSEERLMSYYREQREALSRQDPRKIEQLEALPPEEFYREVRDIYYRQRGAWRVGPPREGEEHREGPGPRGRGDAPRIEGDRPREPFEHGDRSFRSRPGEGRPAGPSPDERREGLLPPPTREEPRPLQGRDIPPLPRE